MPAKDPRAAQAKFKSANREKLRRKRMADYYRNKRAVRANEIEWMNRR